MKWKTVLLYAAILSFFTFFLLAIGAWGLYWDRFVRAPEQPVKFPHSIHAGKLSMPCSFCHASADISRFAGAPPLERCAGCHRSMGRDKPQVSSLSMGWCVSCHRANEASMDCATCHK